MFEKNSQDIRHRQDILLFYREYEADKFIKYDRYLKRILRPIYQMLHHRQKKTGFAVSFELMRRALIKAGYNVLVNDYNYAKKYPNYPVGLVGFPLLLNNWKLPNPAVLGPSLYDHPLLAPNLLEDKRFKKYVVLAPWTLDMYKPVYGDACFVWYAGIDLEEWPDLSHYPKPYDFLVYDKIRWHHNELDVSLLQPILNILNAKGLKYNLVRYKMHDHAMFKKLLQDSKAMIFICEHETQGLAYQEAMASGLPVLAWDRGYWADPLWKNFQKIPPKASSVPFFSSACGEKFSSIEDFNSSLEKFLAHLSTFKPREYVTQNLSMDTSAKIYAEQYFSLL